MQCFYYAWRLGLASNGQNMLLRFHAILQENNSKYMIPNRNHCEGANYSNTLCDFTLNYNDVKWVQPIVLGQRVSYYFYKDMLCMGHIQTSTVQKPREERMLYCLLCLARLTWLG